MQAQQTEGVIVHSVFSVRPKFPPKLTFDNAGKSRVWHFVCATPFGVSMLSHLYLVKLESSTNGVCYGLLSLIVRPVFMPKLTCENGNRFQNNFFAQKTSAGKIHEFYFKFRILNHSNNSKFIEL